MMTLPQLHREMVKEIKNIGEYYEQQNDLIYKQTEMILELSNRLDAQQEHMDNRLEEHDRALMQTLREVLEDKKRKDTTRDENKKGFFARLFNR